MDIEKKDMGVGCNGWILLMFALALLFWTWVVLKVFF